MASKGKSMCVMMNGYDHVLYEDDDDEYLGGLIHNILDFPVESLDEDGLTEDWASKLGPIPSEVFREMLPPVGIGNMDGGGSRSVSVDECGSCNVASCAAELKPVIQKEVLKFQPKPQQQPTFSHEKKLHRLPKSFEAPSPDSVLERRASSSSQKTSFGTEIAIPVRTRTKRSRSHLQLGLAASSWLRSIQQLPMQTVKKKRRKLRQHDDVNEVKKCSHCEITKTPQWREGPMGPKTLCNACGVRYRSGRLYPEYRPAASPTFVASLHSNSHRKVVEMRQKGAAKVDNYVVKKPLSSNVEIEHSRLCS
ncbi:hypothetical protein QVD17_32847 [Tagetes erecta]|uniref:GATA-type domain-containing protein n=1 Tax=Tagetes erecta TaxID=13708 RepID=A0AAD8JY66_TARER|nr:hypothetical protein QVD17_32847 [Tagetes erecta]